MKKFQVISKENCPKCVQLKDFLKKNDLKYDEWKIEDKNITKKLLDDDKFIQNFCDLEGCMVYTPIIRVEESGRYYFKELFGINGIRKEFIFKLLEL